MKKSALCGLLICLFLLSGCKPKQSSDNNKTNHNSPIVQTQSSFIDPEGLTVSEIKPAEISEEEAKNLWCYTTLNETQKHYYKVMLTMVRNLTEGFVSLGYGGTDFSSDIAVAYRAIMNDFPEYYWMPVSYYISADDSVVSIAFKRNSIENGYCFEIFEVENGQEEFLDDVDYLVSLASNAKDDYEKVRILHNVLCNRVKYFDEADEEDQTVYSAYGAIVNGRALCEGYARAFQLLCKRAGIECILVSGTSKNVGHLWNMVKINGVWSHVDVTWDDLTDEPIYTYLNLTDTDILADHDIDIEYNNATPNMISQGHSFNFNLPKANENCNYFIRNNLYFAYDDTSKMAKEVVRRYKQGDMCAQFCFLSQEDMNSFNENYKTLIVKVQENINKELGKVEIKLKTISYSGSTCIFFFTKA